MSDATDQKDGVMINVGKDRMSDDDRVMISERLPTETKLGSF